MNILFILPYDTTYRYRKTFVPSISYQPLTLSMLAALIPATMKCTVTLVDEGVQKIDYSRKHYDIVGITSTTSSAPRAYELAGYFKQRGSYVLLGGHHVSLLPDEALQYADTVFVGTAERTLPQFFEDYAAGTPQNKYTSKDVVASEIPAPRRDMMGKKGYMTHPTVIADYGCPNHCRYCVIHPFWGHNARRPVHAVIDELRLLKKKKILLLDPSPFSDKVYARELLSEMEKLRIKWVGLVALDIANDDSVLDLMQQSGCIGVLSGFETFNATDLAEMQKNKNKVADYKTIVDKWHSRGISVLGTFMIGFDGDTSESLQKLPELIDEIGVDIPRFAILTPYPNTPLFNEYDGQGRIATRDWTKYDSIQCVVHPLQMTPEETEAALLKVWKDSYTFARIFKRVRAARRYRLTALLTNLGFKIYAKKLPKLLNKS